MSGLQNQPVINAVIDGDDIIYRDYVDISIAVGTPKVSLFLFHSRLAEFFIKKSIGRTNIFTEHDAGL